MTAEFVDVTEIEGQRISVEQLDRTCHRYHWAAREVAGRAVLEVACGAGLGLQLLRKSSSQLSAGDYSPEVLARMAPTAADGVELFIFSAEKLPFPQASLDAVILFEALYYLRDPDRFFAEAKRVLRPGGKLLIVTCNKDLFDFNPSPYTYEYLGVVELTRRLTALGFAPTFSAYIDTTTTSLRQRMLRPVKALAARTGLIPRTMHGKRILKRIFFGRLTTMPANIEDVPYDYAAPAPIEGGVADRRHKVIYCNAIIPGDAGAIASLRATEKA